MAAGLLAGTPANAGQAQVPVSGPGPVAIDGTVVAVGDPLRTLSAGSEQGAVHIIERVAGEWQESSLLTASDASAGARFGSAVAISGETMAVGAPGDDDGRGAVYMFTRQATGWVEQTKLVVPPAWLDSLNPAEPGCADRFSDLALGQAVAIDGDRLVVGAPKRPLIWSWDRDPFTGWPCVGFHFDHDVGAAFMFARSANVWTLEGAVSGDARNAQYQRPGSLNYFGTSVAISGTRVAVGAPYQIGESDGPGSVFVFSLAAGVWTEQAYLTLDRTPPADTDPLLGISVALSGDLLVAGASTDDMLNGTAHVYRWTGDAWTSEQSFVNPRWSYLSSSGFGVSVSASQDAALVGLPDFNGTTEGGGARLYVRSSIGWRLAREIRAPDEAPGDWFGWSVAMSGTTAAVRARTASYIVDLRAAPELVQQPLSQAAVVGGTASFSAYALGFPIVQYRWQRSTDAGASWSVLDDGAQFSGTASPTLTIQGVTSGMSGQRFRVVVSNSEGTVSSAEAVLTVPAQPVFNVHPNSVSVVSTRSATFNVVAVGQPAPSVFWEGSSDGGASWWLVPNAGYYSGANTPTLTITSTFAALNGFRYRAVAQNAFGTARSAAATLTVSAIFIEQHPVDQNVQAGQPAQFSVGAVGEISAIVRWEVSMDGGLTWSDVATGGVYGGVFTAVLSIAAAPATLNGARYRAVVRNLQHTETAVTHPARLTVRGAGFAQPAPVRFGAARSGNVFTALTAPQHVTIAFEGAASAWTASSTVSWLRLQSAFGTVRGTLTLEVVPDAAAYVAAGELTGHVIVTATGAPNSPFSVPVTLTVADHGIATSPPIGLVDTPTQNAAGLSGSIAVTGWALDDIQIRRVRIMRDPVAGEGTAPIFIGDATRVEGARPDVAAQYTHMPDRLRAGWGYLLLTNFLPGGGTGTYRLHAYVEDAEGHETLIGSRTIHCDNANATKPFGAIDTPSQGETVSGLINNFGWVLARGPSLAHPPYGQVRVLIDGEFGEAPFGWSPRSDLTALFSQAIYPGVTQAAGVLPIDTSRLSDGVHTIAWVVTADNGATDGIGSRYFTVANGSATPLSTSEPIAALTSLSHSGSVRTALETRAAAQPGAVLVRTGFDPGAPFGELHSDASGRRVVHGQELDRFELHLGGTVRRGHLRIGRTLEALPLGSRLNPQTGVFTWHPGAGFVGVYDMVFVEADDSGNPRNIDVRFMLHPRGGATIQAIIDAPAPNARAGESFVLAGWALDWRDITATGIGAVHVWAYPHDGRPPTFLGVADYGGFRPDVGSYFGERYGRSGFSLDVRGLIPGRYTLAVFPWSTVDGSFGPAQTVAVTIGGGATPQ